MKEQATVQERVAELSGDSDTEGVAAGDVGISSGDG